jgi:hypothetical protein
MKLQVLRLLLALLTFAPVALATDCTDQARADCLQCCNDDESAGFAANSASLTACQTLRDFDNGECNSNSNDDYYNCISTAESDEDLDDCYWTLISDEVECDEQYNADDQACTDAYNAADSVVLSTLAS